MTTHETVARSPDRRDTREATIEVHDLVKTYRGGVRALQGASFLVPSGGVFALLGPNGAGKSTTVKILTTLTRADSGRASVAGHDVNRDPDGVRRAIGFVSQKAAIDPDATGVENLTLQTQLYGIRGATLRSRVDELLERFNLASDGRRLVRTYSGGMQRKLHVAMGLVHQPSVLFLDEPTTGLDPEARVEMWQEITRLAADEGLTVLLTTHYLEEADQLAAQVAIIDLGRVVAQGTPEQLKGELRGDAVQLEFSEPPSEALVHGALARLDGLVHDVILDGRFLRARTDKGANALPAVLSALATTLAATGTTVAAATVSRPSLDAVYLRHTGHVFATGNEGE